MVPYAGIITISAGDDSIELHQDNFRIIFCSIPVGKLP